MTATTTNGPALLNTKTDLKIKKQRDFYSGKMLLPLNQETDLEIKVEGTLESVKAFQGIPIEIIYSNSIDPTTSTPIDKTLLEHEKIILRNNLEKCFSALSHEIAKLDSLESLESKNILKKIKQHLTYNKSPISRQFNTERHITYTLIEKNNATPRSTSSYAARISKKPIYHSSEIKITGITLASNMNDVHHFNDRSLVKASFDLQNNRPDCLLKTVPNKQAEERTILKCEDNPISFTICRKSNVPSGNSYTYDFTAHQVS